MIPVSDAAQITVVFCIIYTCTLLHQVYQKKKWHRLLGSNFDRYRGPEMRDADRLTANFLEWMPVFFGPLWSLALSGAATTTSAASLEEEDKRNNMNEKAAFCVMVAWTYVALRALYVVLVIQYGVNPHGRNVQLWMSTFPSYLCLGYLLVRACRWLF
jgi:hypothetical protein